MKQFSKHYPLDNGYESAMPNNYIVGTDTDDEATIHAENQCCQKRIARFPGEILQRKVYREEGSLAGLKSSLVNFDLTDLPAAQNRFMR